MRGDPRAGISNRIKARLGGGSFTDLGKGPRTPPYVDPKRKPRLSKPDPRTKPDPRGRKTDKGTRTPPYVDRKGKPRVSRPDPRHGNTDGGINTKPDPRGANVDRMRQMLHQIRANKEGLGRAGGEYRGGPGVSVEPGFAGAQTDLPPGTPGMGDYRPPMDEPMPAPGGPPEIYQPQPGGAPDMAGGYEQEMPMPVQAGPPEMYNPQPGGAPGMTGGMGYSKPDPRDPRMTGGDPWREAARRFLPVY